MPNKQYSGFSTLTPNTSSSPPPSSFRSPLWTPFCSDSALYDFKMAGAKQEKEWSIEWHLQITFSLWLWKKGCVKYWWLNHFLRRWVWKKWQIKSSLRLCMGMCWESVLSKGNLWQVLIWGRKREVFLKQVIIRKGKKGKWRKITACFNCDSETL